MEIPPPEHSGKARRPVPLVLFGGVGALLAGAAIAWMLIRADDSKPAPPPASEAGLIIDSSTGDDGSIDPAKPLRCFVQGRFVGELSLADCARRNGVATDALDVGIDESGALAAAEQAGAALVPLPPAEDAYPVAEAPAEALPETAEISAATPGGCWRHGGGRWRRLPGDLGLEACVQSLFAGRCEKPGGASYGRWGQQTLRLVTGRIEVSDDNRSFHLLTPQASDCSIAPLG